MGGGVFGGQTFGVWVLYGLGFRALRSFWVLGSLRDGGGDERHWGLGFRV